MRYGNGRTAALRQLGLEKTALDGPGYGQTFAGPRTLREAGQMSRAGFQFAKTPVNASAALQELGKYPKNPLRAAKTLFPGPITLKDPEDF